MKPRKPIRRSSQRIRSRKADPAKRRFAKQRDPKYKAWIADLGCLICWRRPVDPAHVIPQSRGAPDRSNLVPLCRVHHDEQEGRTPEFEAKYGVSLAATAAELDGRYVFYVESAF